MTTLAKWVGVIGWAATVGLHEPARANVTPAAKAGRSGNAAQQATVPQVLARYGGGEFEAAIDDLVRDGELGEAVERFREGSKPWLSDAAANDRPRRLGIVAIVALELVARGVDGTIDEYESARPLVEWACTLLRREQPSEIERLYHLASVALAQGARDESLLAGGPPRGTRHILHGAERFPGEGRLKLAWLTVRPETRFISSWPLPPGYLLYPATRDPDPRGAMKELQRTLDALGLLVNDPSVGAEAKLRRAALRVAMGQPGVVSADLQDAGRSADPFVRYLAHLLRGVALESTDRRAEAVAAYEAAVRTVPGTAASIALASALFRENRRSEAAGVVETWAGADRTEDPWRLYSLRDYRLFPGYLRTMRALVVQ